MRDVRVGFLRTDVSGERGDAANLFLGDGHDVLRENNKIGQFSCLDRAFDFFFKRQIRVVDGLNTQRLGAADL